MCYVYQNVSVIVSMFCYPITLIHTFIISLYIVKKELRPINGHIFSDRAQYTIQKIERAERVIIYV